jgi:hypothetical protein
MLYGLGVPELLITYLVTYAPVLICIVVAVMAIVWLRGNKRP